MSFQKNILVTYSAQIISVLSSFLCSIMAARMLHTNGQGELALYINFITLGSLLMSIGLPAALVHFIAAKKIEKSIVFTLLLRVIGWSFLLISLVLFLLQYFHSIDILLPQKFSLHSSWLLILVTHLIFLISNSFLSSLLQAESKFKQAGLIGIIGSLTLMLLYTIRFFKPDKWIIEPFEWIILSLLFILIIQFILYLYHLYKIDPTYFNLASTDYSTLKSLFSFAFIAFATNSIQFFSYRMDIWFLNHFQNTSETGIYSLSVSLAQMVWLLPSAVQSVLYAFISTHSNSELIIQKTISTTKQIGLYAISAGILGYILSIWLVPILFGSEFSASIQCIGILLFGIVPFCLTMTISGYFAATGRVKFNLYSAILGFLFCLLFDLILIPRYGIIGASIASVISYLSTLIYLLLKFRVELKTKEI